MSDKYGLKTRTRISNAIDSELFVKLQALSKETMIPMSKLLDRGIEPLRPKRILVINHNAMQAILNDDKYSSLIAKKIADRLGPEFEQYIILNECVSCGKKFAGRLNARCCSAKCSRIYSNNSRAEKDRLSTKNPPVRNKDGNTLQEVFINYLEEKDVSYRIIANEIKMSHQTLNNIKLYNKYSDYTAKLLADYLGAPFEVFPITKLRSVWRLLLF